MSYKLPISMDLGVTLLWMALVVVPPIAPGQEQTKPPAAFDLRNYKNGFITLHEGTGEDARQLFNMMIPEYIKTGDKDLLSGTQDDLLARYKQDFAEGEKSKNKWPE